MAEAKIRLVTIPEVWRISPGTGIKVYVSEDQLARWAQVLAEFDAVQQEMFDVLHEEYEL